MLAPIERLFPPSGEFRISILCHAESVPDQDSPTETFAQAGQVFAALVRDIPADAWDRPGLGEWDLRALVGHTSRSLITVETYLGQPAEHEDVLTPADYYVAIKPLLASTADAASITERGRAAGEALGADPTAFVAELVARVVPLAAAAGDPVITTIAGGMRLRQYLPTRTFELVVHSFDIASAAGLPEPDFPRTVLTETVSLAAAAAVALGSGPLLLRAVTGRSALPVDFSVV